VNRPNLSQLRGEIEHALLMSQTILKGFGVQQPEPDAFALAMARACDHLSQASTHVGAALVKQLQEVRRV